MGSGCSKDILGSVDIDVLHKRDIVDRREDVGGVDDTVDAPVCKNLFQVVPYVAPDKLQFFRGICRRPDIDPSDALHFGFALKEFYKLLPEVT